ncbi:MAG: hemolysin III family protein [Clostridia bacterium]|nr:hemolysin III family protein [Clostridia bacterium]
MKEIDLIEFVNYTKTEEKFNTITHIIGAVLAIIATVMTVIRGNSLGRADELIIGLVYCLSMLTVFVCSSVYHGLPRCRAKKVMRMIDYTAIYLMLMGTITPYMLLSVAKINYTLGWTLFVICLVATVISIVLTLTAFSKTKAIRMILYIVIGLCAFSSIFVIGDKVEPIGVKLVLAGNGAYVSALALFAIGARKPYFHTVFHVLVIVGATIHFINLYLYVFI